MYVRSSQRPRDAADVIAAIRESMFATLVTSSVDGIVATHLPFMIDETRGEHGTLYAHMARANAQGAQLAASSEVLVIFLGPHAYISPSWYQDRATAPTWDYVAVHCYGRPRVHDDVEARANIARLVTLMESGNERPWTMSELTENETAAMVRNVVSFEIAITRIEAKFKLNQGEKADRTATAVAELEARGDGALAALMRRYNR